MLEPRGANDKRKDASPLGATLSQSQILARRIGPLIAEARYHAGRLSAGSHGRRQAGLGESFWQFRNYHPEDGSKRIDWRRSARGDRLYVREKELELAVNFRLWLDPRADFDWKSTGQLRKKREIAAIMLLALARALMRGGERVSILRNSSSNGLRNAPFTVGKIEDLAWQLFSLPEQFPAAKAGRVAYLIASDFYEPIDVWRARLAPLQAIGQSGILLCVSDPVEENFPFSGRTRFRIPSGGDPIMVERAEAIGDAYRQALAQRRQQLQELAKRSAFALVRMQSDQEIAPKLASMAALLRGASV